MSILSIDHEQINFKKVGDFGGYPANTVLLGEVLLFGCPCQVKAFQVHVDASGTPEAVNHYCEMYIDALQDLCGNIKITTATINGLNYVIAVYPYSPKSECTQ